MPGYRPAITGQGWVGDREEQDVLAGQPTRTILIGRRRDPGQLELILAHIEDSHNVGLAPQVVSFDLHPDEEQLPVDVFGQLHIALDRL